MIGMAKSIFTEPVLPKQLMDRKLY